MARGELVPDDVVVAIVADRIGEPDAKKGFILDGFPRTVPQAVALDRMLKDKGLKLDAVIELKVDANILHKRIASRIGEATARGEALRADDDPEVLKRRLEAYREQTAPLVDYYRWQGSLRTIDGMAPIDDVARAIDRALAAASAAPKVKKVSGRSGQPRQSQRIQGQWPIGHGRSPRPQSPGPQSPRPKRAQKPSQAPAARRQGQKAAARNTPAAAAGRRKAGGAKKRQRQALAEVDEPELNSP